MKNLSFLKPAQPHRILLKMQTLVMKESDSDWMKDDIPLCTDNGVIAVDERRIQKIIFLISP